MYPHPGSLTHRSLTLRYLLTSKALRLPGRSPLKIKSALLFSIAWPLLALLSSVAQAVPSFGRQTSLPCSSCHIGSFGPQLNEFGRNFKLNAYTLSASTGTLPISAMLVGISDKSSKDIPNDAVESGFSSNNNSVMQEASVFIAGRATQHSGGFVQVTYSGVDKVSAMDNVDLRYALPTTLAGKAAIVGVSLNNNPTTQDTRNTIPAWGFPYMAADLAPAPDAAPLIAGGLEQQVLGVSGYLFWNNAFYLELGGYKTQASDILKKTNVIESEADLSKIAGNAPYWRFDYDASNNGHTFSAGAFGLSANIHPGASGSDTDKYRDLGIDSSYQILRANNDAFTVNATLIREHQKLNSSYIGGDAARIDNDLQSVTVNSSYYFNNTYGLTLQLFNVEASKSDSSLYSENPYDGSRVGKPNSSGYIVQADYTPFGKSGAYRDSFTNLRVALQYTAYNKFNGSKNNYDGYGRKASDNNTLTAIFWFAL